MNDEEQIRVLYFAEGELRKLLEEIQQRRTALETEQPEFLVGDRVRVRDDAEHYFANFSVPDDLDDHLGVTGRVENFDGHIAGVRFAGMQDCCPLYFPPTALEKVERHIPDDGEEAPLINEGDRVWIKDDIESLCRTDGPGWESDMRWLQRKIRKVNHVERRQSGPDWIYVSFEDRAYGLPATAVEIVGVQEPLSKQGKVCYLRERLQEFLDCAEVQEAETPDHPDDLDGSLWLAKHHAKIAMAETES